MGCITWKLFNKRYINHDPYTGRAYFNPLDESQTIKEAPIFPEQFRRFARMDGNYIWPYVKNVVGGWSGCSSDIAPLLKHFPTWDSIKESDEWAQHGWDETAHNLFKECLEWCDAQGGFWAEWPY
jgi:hypothetical protein